MKLNKTNKYLLFLVAAILLISSAFYAFLPSPIVAPDVSLKTITNKTVQLKQLQGKVVLITFWATDCPSCLQEIPHLKSPD